MLPLLFIERLKKLITDENKLNEILHSFNLEKKSSLRINCLKSSLSEVSIFFKSKNIQFKEVPFCNHALILENISSADLTELSLYQEGKIYLQSLSSMLPALVLNPDKSDKVLDICAAPGSKTTHLAAMMGNTGEIVANDVSGNRLYKLRANLDIQGVTNVKLENNDGRSLWKKYPDYFDKTLVDVPCSMEGRFYTEDLKSYSHWSIKKVKNLARLQRWLLRSAVSATKPGGTIVYSTCTMAPEENEGVIDWLLKKDKGRVELVEFSISGLNFIPGINNWLGKNYSSSVKKTKQIYPDRLMEAFFIAKLNRV